ncbi:hypothetical protein ABPG74_008255 [Tetrahymena malaccensis]
MKIICILLIAALVVANDDNKSHLDNEKTMNKLEVEQLSSYHLQNSKISSGDNDCYQNLIKQAMSDQVCQIDDKDCMLILKALAGCAEHCQNISNKNEHKSANCFRQNCGSDHPEFQNFIRELYSCFSPNINFEINNNFILLFFTVLIIFLYKKYY